MWEQQLPILAPRDCDHEWHPVSMVFETQLHDERVRVQVRQPDPDKGRVYLVCLRCASHTYMSTQWIGFRMYGSEDAVRVRGANGFSRPEWAPDPDDDRQGEP